MKNKPDLCDVCGNLPPDGKTYECPTCGAWVGDCCSAGVGTACFDCENAEADNEHRDTRGRGEE